MSERANKRPTFVSSPLILALHSVGTALSILINRYSSVRLIKLLRVWFRLNWHLQLASANVRQLKTFFAFSFASLPAWDRVELLNVLHSMYTYTIRKRVEKLSNNRLVGKVRLNIEPTFLSSTFQSQFWIKRKSRKFASFARLVSFRLKLKLKCFQSRKCFTSSFGARSGQCKLIESTSARTQTASDKAKKKKRRLNGEEEASSLQHSPTGIRSELTQLLLSSFETRELSYLHSIKVCSFCAHLHSRW